MSVQVVELDSPQTLLDDEHSQALHLSDSSIEDVDEGAATLGSMANRPACFTSSAWQAKLIEYPWLLFSDDKIGCSFCHKVKSLNTHTSSGIKIDSAWRDTKVPCSGSNTKAIKSSIRKKMFYHKDTKAHILAMNILEKQGNSVITKVIDNQNLEFHVSTKRLLTTVYYLAKNNRPFSDHPDLVELQSINGIWLGNSSHSR